MADVNSTVEYRDVEGFPGYRVGNDGSVWSRWGRGRAIASGRVYPWRRLLTGGKAKYYTRVYICKMGASPGEKIKVHVLVHRLVLEVFVGPCPYNMEACHADGVRSNNRLDNLRWDTRKANASDKLRHGTANTGERHGCAKLTTAQVIEMRTTFATGGVKPYELAVIYGVNVGTVRQILRRRHWRHV